MPKIAGATIAEHVAAQEEAVFAAAVQLFTERGVANVSIGDIAQRVGLARTSLYRYFPTKTSIVHRWFESAMVPLIEESNAIAASDAPRSGRLEQWVNLQLDFLTDDNNRAMIRASLETNDMPDDIRASIRLRHRDLYDTLEQIVTTPDVDDAATAARVMLIAGLVRNLNDLENLNLPTSLARQELLRAAAVIAG